MSAENFRKAMDKAWETADSLRYPVPERVALTELWLTIAGMEAQEPVEPKPVGDSFNWSPPKDDPSVVGGRCTECHHFEDNHAAAGCRQCQCRKLSPSFI